MSDEKQPPEEERAAEQRLQTLWEALGNPDPNDDQAMQELWTVRRRISEQLARVITARPAIRSRLHGRVPEPDDGGPRTPEETMLWQLGVTYERTAGLLRVYVGEERIHELPIVTLRGEASLN
jgi:hypothetical protein